MNKARKEGFSDVVQPRIKLQSASLRKEVKKLLSHFFFSVSKNFSDLDKLTLFQSFIMFKGKYYRMESTW